MRKLLQILNNFIYKINLSRHITTHLVGEDHTDRHRRIFGGIIMVIGVSVAKTAHLFTHFSLEVLIDVLGYSIHGIGLIPFVKNIEHEKKQTRTLIYLKKHKRRRHSMKYQINH